MHFERGHVYEESWTDEFRVLAMIAEDVTDILAKIALDAFAEFLNAIDVLLGHAPGAVRRVGGTRFERLDLFLHLEVPGNVRHQVLEWRKSFHWLDSDRLVERQ